MSGLMERSVKVFLNAFSDDELIELLAEKKTGESFGTVYFLGSSDIQVELSNRFDSHLAIFFSI